jgi:beta-lactamase superfamily II metal-dependent hydrolase
MSRANAALARNEGKITLTSRDDAWRMGHAQVRVLWPPVGLDPRTEGAPDNDASLAALLEVPTDAGPRRVLLTGDMTDRALFTLRELEPMLRADVMEAPHHGTTTPGVLAWIGEVNPSIVLQSAAERKSSDRSLDAVRAGRTWHATGLTGHAWVEIMSDGTMRTSTHRRPAQERGTRQRRRQ